MGKVAKEIAIEEIDKWLDKKRVLPSKREFYKDHIDILVEAMSEGLLSLGDDNVFTQELMFPIEGELTIEKLTYKPRLNRKMVTPHMSGVKSGDGDGRIIAYMAALTGQPKNILTSLDHEDSRIADSIVVFFVG